MVPRRAVRKVGPRPDLTRSTHIGEPSDPTGLLGDGSRGLCLPYRGRTSPQVAVERRTKGASPRLRVANVSEPPGGVSSRPGGFVFLRARGFGRGGGGPFSGCFVNGLLG